MTIPRDKEQEKHREGGREGGRERERENYVSSNWTISAYYFNSADVLVHFLWRFITIIYCKKNMRPRLIINPGHPTERSWPKLAVLNNDRRREGPIQECVRAQEATISVMGHPACARLRRRCRTTWWKWIVVFKKMQAFVLLGLSWKVQKRFTLKQKMRFVFPTHGTWLSRINIAEYNNTPANHEALWISLIISQVY